MLGKVGKVYIRLVLLFLALNGILSFEITKIVKLHVIEIILGIIVVEMLIIAIIITGVKLIVSKITAERKKTIDIIREANNEFTDVLILSEIIGKIKKVLSRYIKGEEIIVFLKKDNFYEKFDEKESVYDEYKKERIYIGRSKVLDEIMENKEIFCEKNGMEEGCFDVHVPIFYRNELIAIFTYINHENGNRIKNRDIIEAVMEQAGTVIENATLFTTLGSNLDKIQAIEELIGIVYREKDRMKAIQYILLLVVSRLGAGYRKALYFEYQPENNVLISNNKFYTCFNYLYTSGDEDIKEYELSLNGNTFIVKAFNEDKMIFSVDYDDENDLFVKSYKIENFAAVPVSYENKKYGVILIDTIDKGGIYEIKRDVNILKIFVQNLAIYLGRKILEEENLKTKKLETMIGLASSIVHEVKTPLAGIKGFAGIVSKKYKDDEKIVDYMNKVINEADRINEMATQLLEYSGEKEKVYIMDMVPIYSIIENILRGKKKDIETHQIDVNVDIDERIQIRADLKKLGMAFSNIIKNSIEASKGEDDKIEIKVHRLNNGIELIISDKGIGIEKNFIADIFEPLVTTKMQGTGLGLPIAKNIIEKHGGTIVIESEVGQGTFVRIVLGNG